MEIIVTMMLRPVLTAATLLLCAGASSPFDTRLGPERQIVHALNRLTFGPGPGDVEEVRRIGLDKWIDLQLHPDRIPDNPVLAEKLKPLETLHMDAADIIERYYPLRSANAIRFVPLTDLLTQEQMRKTLNGTAEERRASLLALPPEKREQVLAIVQASVLEGLPELQEEAKMAREKQQEDRNKEMRKMRPPLSELLEPPQIQIAVRGTRAQRLELFASLDPAKRQQVAYSLPPAALGDFPEMRRAAAVSRNSRQVPVSDLREAKLFRAVYSNRQLEEVLTDFWFNHFNVFEGKGPQEQSTLAAYERDAIRPHVLGHFKDLLLATARHPAMLHYLDNWESMSGDFLQVGPFAPGPGGNPSFLARQAHGLNENYGREVMELHTLGVNGGYTQ
ncbi:MAG TPA: DUF1800 family protein, partial [Candidatus Sulfopaludibacter sp.]|nr:DUF1800 family protein [Candidatus Sulfopaludibacter sp.]